MTYKVRGYVLLIFFFSIAGGIGIFLFLQYEKDVSENKRMWQVRIEEKNKEIATTLIAKEEKKTEIPKTEPTKEKDEIVHITTTPLSFPEIERKSVLGFVDSIDEGKIRIKSGLTTSAQEEYDVVINKKTQIINVFRDKKTNTIENREGNLSDIKKDMPVNIFSESDFSKKNIIATKIEYYSE